MVKQVIRESLSNDLFFHNLYSSQGIYHQDNYSVYQSRFTKFDNRCTTCSFLSLPILRLLCPKDQDAKIFEKLLNPVNLVFIG